MATKNITKEETHDHAQDLKWESLLRGQIFAATTNKLMQWIVFADQKAQTMIILNSILIPVTLNFMNNDGFLPPTTISVLASITSIFFALCCIYPKRRGGNRPDGLPNLLHYGDIGRMSEEDYFEKMNPVFNDTKHLAVSTIRDLHDVSKRIIVPKMFWLKLSYGSFFIGNLFALAWVVLLLWH